MKPRSPYPHYPMPFGVTPGELYFTYVLIDPRDHYIRYVGCTSNPRERLMGHIHNELSSAHSFCQELVQQGLLPILNIIDVHPTRSEGFLCEYLWIMRLARLGSPLLNRTVKGMPRLYWKRQQASTNGATP